MNHNLQSLQPQMRHLINTALLLHQTQYFFFMKILSWYPTRTHQDLVLYHLSLLSAPPVDSYLTCYKPCLQIQILQLLKPILLWPPILLQAHACALHNIFQPCTHQRFPVLNQSFHHHLISDMCYTQLP